MKLKKLTGFILFVTVIAVFTVSLIGCTSAGTRQNDKMRIITTNFAVYDWTKEIIGNSESIEVRYLLSSGSDSHSYQATSVDIVDISTCDLLIYIGGESEAWVEDVLANADKINSLKLSSHVNRICHDNTHEHNHAEDDHCADSNFDEHIWLSLKNAIDACRIICNYICEIDSENFDLYTENCNQYIQNLSDLDKEYATAVSQSSSKTLMFADRFPFSYLVSDYGLEYFAAFDGCSADTNASFEIIASLASKADELSLTSVIILENSDNSLAKTVIENTLKKDLKILVLDSIQSVNSKKIPPDYSYYNAMVSNLRVIKEALN